MRSEVRVAPVFRNILYAQAWEDPAIDREALAIGPEDDVFAICASGDNALAFLLDDPRSVVALDFNLTQCCLLELKMAAFERLEHGALLELLGVRASSQRAALYRRLRDALSESARSYWDEHLPTIEAGVIHAGRFEGYFAKFRRWILPLAVSRRTLERMLAARSLEEQREIFDREWNTWRWRALFKVFFSRGVMGALGRDPAMFKYVEGSVATEILARAEHGLTAVPAWTNWFLEYIARGRYDDPESERLPPYLQARHFETIRNRLDRLTVVNDEIEAYLPAQPEGRFSAWYLSDIFEYMSEEAAKALFEEIWRTSREGARLSYREMMVARPVPEALHERLCEDEALGRKLHARDRSFFYGAHRVVRVRKPNGEPPGAGEALAS